MSRSRARTLNPQVLSGSSASGRLLTGPGRCPSPEGTDRPARGASLGPTSPDRYLVGRGTARALLPGSILLRDSSMNCALGLNATGPDIPSANAAAICRCTSALIRRRVGEQRPRADHQALHPRRHLIWSSRTSNLFHGTGRHRTNHIGGGCHVDTGEPRLRGVNTYGGSRYARSTPAEPRHRPHFPSGRRRPPDTPRAWRPVSAPPAQSARPPTRRASSPRPQRRQARRKVGRSPRHRSLGHPKLRTGLSCIEPRRPVEVQQFGRNTGQLGHMRSSRVWCCRSPGRTWQALEPPWWRRVGAFEWQVKGTEMTPCARCLVGSAAQPAPGRGGSYFGKRSRFRKSAFTATRRLDPDIERAAISGRSTSPKAGSNTPAAIGSATEL
jgi:hypothetical protein